MLSPSLTYYLLLLKMFNGRALGGYFSELFLITLNDQVFEDEERVSYRVIGRKEVK